MRLFYAFLLLLVAWAGFVQTALKDDHRDWQKWDAPR
jgi:hypothetical protein